MFPVNNSTKDDWTCKPVHFLNPSPFITINYDGSDVVFPGNSNVRIILDKYYSKDEIEGIRSKINRKCIAKSIVFVEKGNKEA